MNRVLVVGAGAWGTALAIQAARAGSDATLWARDPAPIAARRESRRLPGVRLPAEVRVSGDLAAEADAILLAIPMQQLRAVAARLPPGPAPLIACAKGVEAGSFLFPLEVLAEIQPGRGLAVLAGPNFAREIAAGQPAATVIAGHDAAVREQVSALLATPAFRIYGNDDPVGAQVGGAAKNVIAIAAGAVIGAGLGENARAGLVTRGLAELSRLSAVLGGQPETVTGLSGLGDLVLTCTGGASRNFTLGIALGRGKRLAEVLAGRAAVAEGVATAPALVARAARLDLPICGTVADLLAERIGIQDAIGQLLSRPRRDE